VEEKSREQQVQGPAERVRGDVKAGKPLQGVLGVDSLNYGFGTEALDGVHLGKAGQDVDRKGRE
jgi:hypothetical protein